MVLGEEFCQREEFLFFSDILFEEIVITPDFELIQALTIRLT